MGDLEGPGPRAAGGIGRFRLADSWVWDFWLADDGEQYHLFFLYASRALGDLEVRRHRPAIGRAVSVDLTRVVTDLGRPWARRPGASDELATWTGCVVRHPDGTWFQVPHRRLPWRR